jgi:putative ABC transport system permease protein
MSWMETFRTGLDAVRTHRMRSSLTVLGILIGIAAVILTVGLGEGAQAQVSSEISALGTNLLTITPGSSTSSTGIRGGLGSASTLTMADATALSSKVVAPDIQAVAPTVQSSETLTAGTSNWTTTVVGSTVDWLSVRGRSLAEGRFFDHQEVAEDAAVTVLAPTTAEELFGFEDPVGQTVDVDGIPMTVIGVLTSAGSSSSSSSSSTSSSTSSTEDDQAVVPISTASQRIFGGTSRTSVQSILIEATSSNALSAAYQEADAELLSLHHITTPADADFTITSQQSLLSTATSVDKTLTVLLAGIAAISLLVGGIGVMNIMLVSVTERIREIGLRKALGAAPGVIRRQFLVEASVLGLAGGLLGAALGLLGAAVLPHLISDHIAISPFATVGAIAVAIAIGVGFGVYPASRAARLAPIDALRNE